MKGDTDLISYADSNQLAIIPCYTALRLLPDTEGKRIIIDLETHVISSRFGSDGNYPTYFPIPKLELHNIC